MLVLGAAGFIGSAACEYYRDRFHVVGIDDFSHCPMFGSGGGIPVIHSDASEVPRFFPKHLDVVLHLAGQVSVMASLADPEDDLTRNAMLTLKLARWAVKVGVNTFIYASTNKVFGELPGWNIQIKDGHPIFPQTPYGISKATGGMYVREFLPKVGFVFHQSCIMGSDQEFHSTENQAWIGYLIRRIREGKPITCYGDGSQVRDLLHVSDLLKAYDWAIEGKIEPGSYTVGGGVENAVSFQQAVDLLGGTITEYRPARPRDQRYFVAASDGLRAAGWKPVVNAREWLKLNAPT